jgi:hypothetical protein
MYLSGLQIFGELGGFIMEGMGFWISRIFLHFEIISTKKFKNAHSQCSYFNKSTQNIFLFYDNLEFVLLEIHVDENIIAFHMHAFTIHALNFQHY